VAAVIGQKLVQHFLGGDERRLAERPHHMYSFSVPLIFVVGDGYPIHGVGKQPPHGDDGRFGVP
jgi:hypothetical protein